ncbi:MAG TPA: hypothetical protein VMQ58_02665 [Candidatus Saccharimonadales bacterium]|jgi:hypothetical protein|nr:hypothetical protein [Candidatus Saccharimonadales bacterium]
MERTTFFPYPPRPGASHETINLDLKENSLTDVEKSVLSEVVEFEHQLYDSSLDSIKYPNAEEYRKEKNANVTPIEALETIWQRNINSVDLGVNYFLTAEGKAALVKAFGVDTDFSSVEECEQILSGLDLHSIDSTTLDDLEAASVGYEEEHLTKTFIDNDFNGLIVPSPNIITVFKNPETILQKARGYRQLKIYVSKAITDLKATRTEDSLDASNAKILIAELYQKRLNVLLVNMYIDSYKLLSQDRKSRSNFSSDLINQLEKLLPAFFSNSDNLRIANSLQRYDRYRYGVSINEHGKFTWLSPAANNLAHEAYQNHKESREIDRGLYKDIDPTILDTLEIDGQIMGDWVKVVLKEYDFLSEYEEWNSEREGPAPDSKWQVIVSDKFKSLAVNDKQRIVQVPTKSRSILLAISLINHEIVHVIQHQNKRAIGNLAILDKIGLDQASEQTEAGGKWQEKVAKEALSGVNINEIAGTSYLKALLVKAKGGSFGECAEAYYRDLSKRDPKSSHEKLAAQAINRTRRIFRSGGFEFAQNTNLLTDTQSLSYLEQELIYSELTNDQRRMLFIGGVTIRNLIKLSNHRLVDLDKVNIPKKMPWEILYPFVKDFISKQ